MKVVSTDFIFKDSNIEMETFAKEGIEWVKSNSLDLEELKKICKDADGIITTYGDINKELIDSLGNCKVIVRTGMGVNNIDIDAATQRGIIVANVRDYCNDEVSDQALAFIMALVRKVPYIDKTVREKNRWTVQDARPIQRISDMVVCLLGFGAISKALSKKLKVIGFKVFAYDPYVDASVFEDWGVERIKDLDAIYPIADVLSVHLPLTKETKDTVTMKQMKMMKSSAYIINVARGGLVNEKDLYIALKDKIIAGAALDVLEDEHPDLSKEPLAQLDNILLSPHIGYYSEGSELALQRGAIEQAILALKTGKPKYFVNEKELKK
ncbi:MAG: C-terminal binding protein [Oscillospiraceae bacterium]